MFEILLVIFPVLMAFIFLALGKDRKELIRTLLVILGVIQLAGHCAIVIFPQYNQAWCPNYIDSDIYGIIINTIVSLVFSCATIFSMTWIGSVQRFEAGIHMMKEHRFAALMSLFLASMTLVGFARNFGLLWIAIEATTLLSAPLICFQRTKGALEAMWKYLLICSLGIGLALFGIFFLDVAFAGNHGGLSFDSLASASNINTQWCKVAFIFCFAGFGLKMGLAPFHNWLPDAYSESASPVAALMSAGLINCSFLAILRVLSVMPIQLAKFYKEFMIIFGVLSLLTAAFFMIHQIDYKRMLAYSSVEHMGILSILWALDAKEMAILHMCMHSMLKMLLFFVAGNIALAYVSTKVKAVNGMINRMPLNAVLWGLGILMICGMPPSPLFISEFFLIKNAGPVLGGIVIVLLFTIFAAMTKNMMSMALGKDPLTEFRPRYQVADKLAVLPAVLMAIPLLIGIYLLINFTGGIL